MNLEKAKVMECGSQGEVIHSRIDSSGICGKRVTVNLVLFTKYDQWIHERCFKLKKVTQSAARLFVCNKCDKVSVIRCRRSATRGNV